MNLTIEMNSPRSTDGDHHVATMNTSTTGSPSTSAVVTSTTPGSPSTSASPSVGFTIPKASSKHEIYEDKKNSSKHKSTREFSETYHLKKHALRKTLGLQIGLSIAFFIQLIGLGFLPGALGWQFSLLFYHNFSNFAQLSFVIILLIIFNPLKEVQRLFEKAPNFLNNDKTVKAQGEEIQIEIQKVDPSPANV